MALPNAAKENLRFLVAEVYAQCGSLREALGDNALEALNRVGDRAGYANNLKYRVQGACMSQIAELSERDQVRVNALSEVAHQLERITDKFRDIARCFIAADASKHLRSRRFKAPLARLATSIDGLADELPPTSSERALALAGTARGLDAAVAKLHRDFVTAMGEDSSQAAALSQGLLMANALRQIGDSLLRISESLLSLQLGQAMNFERFQSLQSILDRYPELSGSRVKALAQTRSGSAIAGLTPKKSRAPAAVFKEGLPEKLKKERQGLESWQSVLPGLTPKILAYQKQGKSASLLIEHLPGFTFEQLLHGSDEALFAECSKALRSTLKDVWQATRAKEPVAANFMMQLSARLTDIEAVHGSLLGGNVRIGGYRQSSFRQLIKQVGRVERKYPPPFSVYIHGDFNIDNVIYDPGSARIHFIDLHRSRHMDYLQDISVFMVSCFRQPRRSETFDARLLDVVGGMDQLGRRFAKRHGDDSYDLRLAIGLARSFATSARYMSDQQRARDFLARSRWLMERVLDIRPARVSEFRLPHQEIFSDVYPR